MKERSKEVGVVAGDALVMNDATVQVLASSVHQTRTMLQRIFKMIRFYKVFALVAIDSSTTNTRFTFSRLRFASDKETTPRHKQCRLSE